MESGYIKIRKKNMRTLLMDFLVNVVLPREEYLSYDDLNELKSFVSNGEEENGIYGAFCDYWGLGRWFEAAMEDCDFDLDDFYSEYAREIEYRCID